eukprot:m.46307 g.46307  ORF g.46307 m.46307 type:complete len:259 (+) comp7261_c0_seq1:3563-4339(+)
MPLPSAVKQRLDEDPNRRPRSGGNNNIRYAPPSSRGGRGGSEKEAEEVIGEIDISHDTMNAVLSSRLVRVKASCVLADQGIDAVMSHIARINDKALLVDFVPILVTEINNAKANGVDGDGEDASLGGIFTNRFTNNNSRRRDRSRFPQQQPKPMDSVQQEATIGACLDLMDLMEDLLKSPYEEYVVAALNLLSAIIERWNTDFQQSASVSTQSSATLSARSIFMKIAPFVSMVENLTVRKEPALAKIATKLQKQLDLL